MLFAVARALPTFWLLVIRLHQLGVMHLLVVLVLLAPWRLISVVSIGEGAFQACPNFTDIYCYASVPPTVRYSLSYTFDNYSIPLYVPTGTKSAYQSAEVWKLFTNVTDKSFVRRGEGRSWRRSSGRLLRIGDSCQEASDGWSDQRGTNARYLHPSRPIR